jgi:hypothetical protein
MNGTDAYIPGGFAKSWRKELDSEIWRMAPLYHRVWYWLRLNVQYETFLFPTPGKFGIWVLPGQRVTSLQQIAEGVKWSEWGRDVVPNKKTIKGILDWLVSREMVTIESNAKGTLITVVNWNTYNQGKSEKVTVESNAKETRFGHKEERIERIEEKQKPLLDFFEELWKAYPRKEGKKGALRHYRATVKTDDDMDRIDGALGNYLHRLESNDTAPQFIQKGETWFNNWQDWEPEEETDAG